MSFGRALKRTAMHTEMYARRTYCVSAKPLAGKNTHCRFYASSRPTLDKYACDLFMRGRLFLCCTDFCYGTARKKEHRESKEREKLLIYESCM